jgi:hypothetical protein
VPTVVLDQLVKGVVAADDELELEEPLPAQATNKIGIPHNKIDFKITPIQYLLDLQNVKGRWSKTTLEIISKKASLSWTQSLSTRSALSSRFYI